MCESSNGRTGRTRAEYRQQISETAQARREDVVRRLKAGETQAEIARELDVSPQAISRVVRRARELGMLDAADKT